MLDKFVVGWRNMVVVCDRRNSMNLMVRFHGGVIVYIIR